MLAPHPVPSSFRLGTLRTRSGYFLIYFFLPVRLEPHQYVYTAAESHQDAPVPGAHKLNMLFEPRGDGFRTMCISLSSLLRSAAGYWPAEGRTEAGRAPRQIGKSKRRLFLGDYFCQERNGSCRKPDSQARTPLRRPQSRRTHARRSPFNVPHTDTVCLGDCGDCYSTISRRSESHVFGRQGR